MKLFTVTVLASLAASALAYCPNACSGHGTCGSNDKCACYSNWMGSDCSLRECASHLAWVDAPIANEVAHEYAECSNKGVCDRESGSCVCYEGYEGKACQRMSCPNDCSGHGRCLPIDMLSTYTYTQWDAKKAQGCVCDSGYSGVDCSDRLCPKGDDPLTTDQKDRVYLFNMYGGRTGEFVFRIKDNFGATWTTRPLVYRRWVVDGEAATGATAAGTTFTVTNGEIRVGDVVEEAVGSTKHVVTSITGADVTVDPALAGTSTLNRIFDGATAAQITQAFEDLPNSVADVTVARNSTHTGLVADVLKTTHGAGLSYSITFHYPSNFLMTNALAVDWTACTAVGCSPYVLGLTALGSDSYATSLDLAGTAVSGATVTLAGTYAQSITGTATDSTGFSNHGLVEIKMTDATNGIYRTNTNGAYSASTDFSSAVTVFDGVTVVVGGATAGDTIHVELPFGVELYDITAISCGEDYREATECSGRGLCDYETGICQCFQGYTDDDCSIQSTLV